MRFGVRLGIDPGDARIGVARSDPSGMLATPVETVKRGKGDLVRLSEIAAEIAAESTLIEVVVGLPRSLGGGEGPSAAQGSWRSSDLLQVRRAGRGAGGHAAAAWSTSRTSSRRSGRRWAPVCWIESMEWPEQQARAAWA